jgi:hypothetical protein
VPRRVLTTALLVLLGAVLAVAIVAFFVSRDDGTLESAAPAGTRVALA